MKTGTTRALAGWQDASLQLERAFIDGLIRDEPTSQPTKPGQED